MLIQELQETVEKIHNKPTNNGRVTYIVCSKVLYDYAKSKGIKVVLNNKLYKGR